MFRGVFVFSAFPPSFALGFADHFFRTAERNSVFRGETLRAFGDKHHVRAIFENFSRGLDGIPHALQGGGGASAKRRAVHDDGVTFDAAIEIEVRAVAGIEDGIILEDHDGSFDGVEGRSAAREDGPASSERAMAAGLASFNRFVGNIPGTAVNNQRSFHRIENGKGILVCLLDRQIRTERFDTESTGDSEIRDDAQI